MKRLALFVLFWGGAVAAHEVHHDIAAAGAVVVRLSYADGSPFAYEKYELFPDGEDVPAQVGNSDVQGRVVFIPDDTTDWRLKAYSADGHGVDLKFAAPAAHAGASAPVAPPVAAGPDRPMQVLIGLCVLFGLFGLAQLFLRRRKP